MKLRFDNHTNRVTDYDSQVYIEMNSTETMEDILGFSKQGYIFKEMVTALVQEGWVRQKNIFGIPQDWRKSTKDKDFSYYAAAHALIYEKLKKIGKKATLVCHSYGCINLAEMIRLFLAEDLNPHIGDIIAIGAPWGGSMNALSALMSGDNFNSSFLNPEFLQNIMRTHTSLVHLIPVRRVLKYPDFVHIPGAIYTHDNISEALNLPKVDPDMLRNRADIDTLINAFDKLDSSIVKITNIYGTGIPTLSRLNYKDKTKISYKTLDKELHDRGDGTVGNASLSLICVKNYTRCIELKGIEHLQSIKIKFVFDLIANASKG